MKSTIAAIRLARPKNANGIQIPKISANTPLRNRITVPNPN